MGTNVKEEIKAYYGSIAKRVTANKKKLLLRERNMLRRERIGLRA